MTLVCSKCRLQIKNRNKLQWFGPIFYFGRRNGEGGTLLCSKCRLKLKKNRTKLQWFGPVFNCTVEPALGDPLRERPPAVCGHFVNVPTHFKVKLPVISGHLPNADADSHLLVVSTYYNGECKQMPRFRWSFQPKIAGAHLNLRPAADISLKFPCCRLVIMTMRVFIRNIAGGDSIM